MSHEIHGTRVEQSQCDVCGDTHEHLVRLYEFDMVERSFNSSETIGPVTLMVDGYGEWYAMADDGFTLIDQYWNSDDNTVTIEVVKEGADASS